MSESELRIALGHAGDRMVGFGHIDIDRCGSGYVLSLRSGELHYAIRIEDDPPRDMVNTAVGLFREWWLREIDPNASRNYDRLVLRKAVLSSQAKSRRDRQLTDAEMQSLMRRYDYDEIDLLRGPNFEHGARDLVRRLKRRRQANARRARGQSAQEE